MLLHIAKKIGSTEKVGARGELKRERERERVHG
jgi:hypothetical protein